MVSVHESLIKYHMYLESERNFRSEGQAKLDYIDYICCLIWFFITDNSARPAARTASSIILRGPNDYYCDEMERSVHDALCVIKRVLESSSVVCGGGAVEAALSVYLENFATSLVSCNVFLGKFSVGRWGC